MTELRDVDPDQVERAAKEPSGQLEPVHIPGPRAGKTDLPDGRFINRELSWLDFNARVLALAEEPETPLLERAKFLAIFATNLDEFYMVRVAGLKQQIGRKSARTVDGLTIAEQLRHISARAGELMERHASCFTKDIQPALEAQGVRLACYRDLGPDDQSRLGAYFREHVFPVLTPLAVDPAHPFPYISGLSLNLAVTVKHPRQDGEQFARIKVPPNVPRYVRVEENSWLPIEELIGAHLPQLFPGMEVVDSHVFRVTRNADLEVEDDETDDLLQTMQEELARRRFGPAVRLEVGSDMDDDVLDLLMRELQVEDEDVHRLPGPLDLSALWSLYALDRPDLKDPPHVTKPHPRLQRAADEGEDIFSLLREGEDILVHHPYDSFTTSTQRFLEQAAADPNVLAIKQTLYRTSGDSPVVHALINAAEGGKQVVVLVEIKARFDESANIKWARELERAGCHVVYGLIGLKTHCKTLLVVRQEGGRLRRYCHLGTGNYNPKTARLYEDLGLLTADPQIGADLTDLFNVLTGYSRQTRYNNLLVAPRRLRQGIIERIRGEAEAASAGKPAGIRMKMNSLVDDLVIDELYRASRVGVPIDCVVRGICALRPGVADLSETIRVRSILGRFLEHSRIFHFRSTGQYLIGSADMMHRNLDRRIESLVQVQAPELREQLGGILDMALSPDILRWELDAEGAWTRIATSASGARLRDYQSELTDWTLRRLTG